MKLELKHLKYYIDYSLDMVSSASGRGAYVTTLKRRLKKSEYLTPELIDVFLFLNRKPVLKRIESIDKDDWMRVFLKGIPEKDKHIYEKMDLQIHVTNEVIRLYDNDEGFKFILPNKTIVSFVINNKCFISDYRFNPLDSYEMMYAIHLDLHELIENNLAIDKATI